MNTKPTMQWALLLALLVVVLIVAGCRIRIHDTEQTDDTDQVHDTEQKLGLIDTPNPDGLQLGPLIGRLAPNFRLENMEGEHVLLSDLRGTPVFLNFWAVWCGPCRYEMPEMERVYRQLGDKVAFLAVDLDEPKERVEVYIDLLEITFPIVLDDGAVVTRAYGVAGFPSTYLIDEIGVIRNIKVGAFLSEAEILDRLEGLGFLD